MVVLTFSLESMSYCCFNKYHRQSHLKLLSRPSFKEKPCGLMGGIKNYEHMCFKQKTKVLMLDYAILLNVLRLK